MKITNVEAIYLRQSSVKHQCDSVQDALVVRISTDAGITGIGEEALARFSQQDNESLICDLLE
jgi:L-alanine-DL-glutamate epimerase-like enolase superfamily enzyme